MKKVKVIREDENGRNIFFQNTGNNEIMSRTKFINRIKNPNSSYHKDYYVRKINGLDTPVSKPDNNKKNNLE